ncbi:MAG: autotransporter-associated beta strand repeat-containing protein [Gemmataceae bacterium]
MRQKTRWLKSFMDRLPGKGRPSRRSPAGARRGPGLESLEDRLAPATHTWTGASGTDLNWGTAGNWTGGAPANGEGGPIVLNFPAVAAGLKATVVNIPGLNVDQINITAGGYSFGAAVATTLNLTGSTNPAVSDTTGGNSFLSPLTVNLSATSVFQIGAGSDTVSGPVSGAGGLTLGGAGSLTLSGTGSYTGTTTVNGGATLRLGSATALSSSTNVVANGTFDLNGFGTTIASLSGTGTATDSGAAATLTVNTVGSVTFNGLLSGSLALTQAGSGQFILTNSGNSYTGLTTVNAGGLQANADHVFGGTAAGTIVNSGGTLSLGAANYTTAEPLQINGTGGAFIGALQSQLTSTFAGPITLGSDSSIRLAFANSFLTLTGTVNSLGSARNLTVSATVGNSSLTLQAAVGGTLPLNTITVSSGVLVVNTSVVGNVSNAGTLNGNGTITGDVSGGGIFSPGNSPGTMTINGNFTPTGTVNFEVNAPFTTPGTDYDQYIVSGAVDLSGATLTFTNNIPGPAPALPNVVTLISKTSVGATTPSGNPADGATVPVGTANFKVFYNSGTGGNDVVLANANPTPVYVDDDWTGFSDGTIIPDADPVAPGPQPAVFGANAFATIQGGVNAVAAGGTVLVNSPGSNVAPSGAYAENVSITKSLTLDGNAISGLAADVVIDPAAAGPAITASGAGLSVTVRDLRVTGATGATGDGIRATGLSGLAVNNVLADTNAGDGVNAASVGSLTLTSVSATGNTGVGARGTGLGGATVTGGTFGTAAASDGLNFAAVGDVTFNGTGVTANLVVGANNINLNTATVTVSGSVSLTAQNAVNVNAGLSANGTVAVLANQDGSGTQSFTMGAAGSIATTNASAAAVSVGVGGAGNATVAVITTPTTAGAKVTIAAGGSILDDNNQATRITTDVLAMTAGVDIGQPLTGPLNQDIDTTVNSITAATTNSPNAGTHGVWVGDTDAVTLTSVTTADGLIRITAGGTITATLVTAAGTGRNVTLIASAGNVQAGTVSAAAGNVTLTATAGSVLDDGVQATLVSGNAVALTAGSGTIGAAGNGDIDLGSTTLTATSSAASGSQFLRETGTALLAAANALNAGAGTITLTAGTFQAQASAGGNAVADTSPLVVQAGATFNLNNNNETVTSLSDGGGPGGNVTLGSGTLTTGDATSTTFSGVISGTGGLTKVGSGAFTLAGLNTYTGTTNVNAGTLTVTGAINNAATPAGGLVNLNTAGVILNGGGTVKGQVVVVASNNTVPANNTRIDGLTITVPAGGTGIRVPAAATFAQVGTTTGVILNGGNATSTGILVQGSARVFNSSIQAQNVGIRVAGGRAALQGDTLTPGTGSLVTGLLISAGGIVDAGQLAPSATPLPNGAAGNVGYYGDITGLFSGTPLGSTAHSAGGNTFGTVGSPFSLDTSATATPNPGPNIPQAIRDLNTGAAPFGPLANGVEQSFNYGSPGPLLGRMDATAQANTWNGNASLPLFQIEQLIFHDLDDTTVGFVTYGNPTAPAPVVVGPVTYTASVNPGLTAVQAGTSTLLAGGNLNNGQKSAIRFLRVTFSSFVFLDPNLQSPTTNRGLNLIQVNGPAFLPGNTNPALGRLIRAGVSGTVYNRLTGAYSVTYNFSGPGVEYGSLEDGNYTLQFNRAAIQGGGPGGPALSVAGDPFAAQAAAFHRLFGDANGDAVVDAVTDLAAFQAAYRTRIGQAAYRAYFDFLNNGIVDSVSYYQFLRRYKTRLNPDGTLTPVP